MFEVVDIEGSGWTRVDSSRLLCSQGFSLGNFLPSSGVLVSGAIYHGLRRAFRTLTMFEMVDKEGSGWTRVDSSRLLCSQALAWEPSLSSSQALAWGFPPFLGGVGIRGNLPRVASSVSNINNVRNGRQRGLRLDKGR